MACSAKPHSFSLIGDPSILAFLPRSALDWHRDGGHPPTPATPPCVRVRTRRFELVTLAFIDQRWKSERFEVGVGKPNREGFGPSEVPGTASATGRVASQSRTNAQCQPCRSTTAGCFPLPPQSCTQSQPDPTSQVNQHIWRFTETEIASPAPEIGSQFRDCRFHADAFGPSRGFPDSMLKPFQSLRRNHALNLWTGTKAKSEELPFLRSRHRALGLIHFEFELAGDEPRYGFPSPADRPVGCLRRCCNHPRIAGSGVRVALTLGRVRRARGWITGVKVDLPGECLLRWV